MKKDDVTCKRLRDLHEIETTCIRARVGGSYAFSRASTPTFLAAIAGFAVAYFGYCYVPNWPLSPISGLMVTMAISAFVFVMVYRRQPFKTFGAKIYSLLTKYDPVDTTGYARLQEKAMDSDVLLDDIFTWVLSERSAVIGHTHVPEADQARVLFANARKEPSAVIALRSKR